MSLDFKSGSYSVQTGRTFLDPSDSGHDFYTLRFNSKLDPSMPSRKASLRQDRDTYYADWTLSDNAISYEGTKGNLQELECLLVYDEETQTFTVERPAVKMTMKKARKKKSNGSLVENGQQPSASKKAQPHSSTPMKAKSHSTTTVKPTSSPSAIKRPSDWLATPPTTKDNSSQQRSSPISLALPPSQPPIQHRKDTLKAPPPPPPPLDTTDSFDDDILRDMDEILNSNDEDEGNDDDDDEFETITSPYHANVDQTIHASPQSVQPLTPNTGKRRRPALKMASAPIRRLDASPPTPAPVTTLPRQQQQQQGNKRPRVGGKTISAETLAARRKAASAIRSDSSSGSSSSDTDSDDDSGSSGSDSDSDSDMDLLAANISRGLSEEVVAPSPYSHTTMNNLTPNNSSSSNLTPNGLVNGGSARPRSLRDLLDGNQRDDDDVSSSGSSSDDDG